MTKVTVDAELRKRLLFFTTPLEFCDANGIVIARYTPSTPWNDPDNWVGFNPEISEEEMDRRINSDERTYTTQEIIEMIKAL